MSECASGSQLVYHKCFDADERQWLAGAAVGGRRGADAGTLRRAVIATTLIILWPI